MARILEVLTRKTCQFDEILAKKENFAISLRNDQKFMYKNAIKLGILVKFDRGAYIGSDFGGFDQKNLPI